MEKQKVNGIGLMVAVDIMIRTTLKMKLSLVLKVIYILINRNKMDREKLFAKDTVRWKDDDSNGSI